MTEPPLPSTGHLLRAGLPGVLGGFAVIVALLVLYAVVPEPTGDEQPWPVFAFISVVVLIYSAGAVWSLLYISRAKHPVRAGLITLAVMLTALVVIFALTYLSLSSENPGSFNVPLTKVGALYFTMTILATVGFGDIVAVSDSARIVVMVQMVVGLTLVTALARVLMETTRRAARKRRAEQDQAGLP